MKKIVIFLGAILICSFVYSQNTIIVESGLLVSKQSPLFNREYKDINSRLAPSIGLIMSNYFSLNPKLFFNFGLKYQRIGECFKRVETVTSSGLYVTGGGYTVAGPYDIKSSYQLYFDEIKIPIYLGYQIKDFRVYSGMNIGYILGGKFNYDIWSTDISSHFLEKGSCKISSHSKTSDNNTLSIRKMDYTMLLGLGYKINHFGIVLNYEYAIRYIDNEDFNSIGLKNTKESPYTLRFNDFKSKRDGRLRPRLLSLNLQYYFK